MGNIFEQPRASAGKEEQAGFADEHFNQIKKYNVEITEKKKKLYEQIPLVTAKLKEAQTRADKILNQIKSLEKNDGLSEVKDKVTRESKRVIEAHAAGNLSEYNRDKNLNDLWNEQQQKVAAFNTNHPELRGLIDQHNKILQEEVFPLQRKRDALKNEYKNTNYRIENQVDFDKFKAEGLAFEGDISSL